jgi:hypothetical protein
MATFGAELVSKSESAEYFVKFLHGGLTNREASNNAKKHRKRGNIYIYMTIYLHIELTSLYIIV